MTRKRGQNDPKNAVSPSNGDQRTGERASGRASGDKASSGPPGGRRRKSWLATHGHDLRFLLIFGVLMGIYFLATTTSTVKDRFIPWYLETSARACGGILNLFGDADVRVEGNAMISKKDRRSVSVERGCDALAPSALFVSAVLASPVALHSRLLAAGLGTLLLLVINLFRIISLYLTRVHWPQAFDVMHLDVWQSLFIFLAILFWAIWATWERRRVLRKRHAGI